MSNTMKRPPSTGGKTSPERLKSAERQAEAIRLRSQGLSYPAIAKRLGFRSRQAAFDAVRRALDSTIREPADELRQLDLLRLDRLWRAHYPAACAGDQQATATCLRIMERRSRLLGLDVPTTIAARAELRFGGGVLVVPSPMTEADWTAAAFEQQAELLGRERAVWSEITQGAA
jgi:hypothetical protein